jgi:hypothetical protein
MSVSDPLDPIIHRLAACIRLLSSDKAYEAEGAMSGIQRLLRSANDVHALADRIEKANGSLSEDDKKKIRAEIERAYTNGYAEGVRMTEAQQHGAGAFRNTDGKLEWTEVALYVQREKQRLDARHHEFVDDMASRTVWGREPTPKQHKYLHSLFHKLGGKIT